MTSDYDDYEVTRDDVNDLMSFACTQAAITIVNSVLEPIYTVTSLHTMQNYLSDYKYWTKYLART